MVSCRGCGGWNLNSSLQRDKKKPWMPLECHCFRCDSDKVDTTFWSIKLTNNAADTGKSSWYYSSLSSVLRSRRQTGHSRASHQLQGLMVRGLTFPQAQGPGILKNQPVSPVTPWHMVHIISFMYYRDSPRNCFNDFVSSVLQSVSVNPRAWKYWRMQFAHVSNHNFWEKTHQGLLALNFIDHRLKSCFLYNILQFKWTKQSLPSNPFTVKGLLPGL